MQAALFVFFWWGQGGRAFQSDTKLPTNGRTAWSVEFFPVVFFLFSAGGRHMKVSYVNDDELFLCVWPFSKNQETLFVFDDGIGSLARKTSRDSSPLKDNYVKNGYMTGYHFARLMTLSFAILSASWLVYFRTGRPPPSNLHHRKTAGCFLLFMFRIYIFFFYDHRQQLNVHGRRYQPFGGNEFTCQWVEKCWQLKSFFAGGLLEKNSCLIYQWWWIVITALPYDTRRCLCGVIYTLPLWKRFNTPFRKGFSKGKKWWSTRQYCLLG